MCTALQGLSTFVYLAAWSTILYYMIHRNLRQVRHVIIPILLLVLNSITLGVNINSDCSMHLVKVGAATEAVLLFILVLNTADHYSARYVYAPRNTSTPRSARRNQEEA